MTTNPLRAARGTTSTLETRALETGELAYNTTTLRLHVGNGSTLGGIPQASQVDVGYTPEMFGAVGDGSTDDTTAVQTCFTEAAADGVAANLLGKTYIVYGLSIPNGLMIRGVGDSYASGACSVLKLKASTNTYIAASAGYISNSSTVTYGGLIENVRFDGNSANQSSAAPLLILRSYRQHVIGCTFYDSKGRGVLVTPISANSTVISNGMAENHILNCNFDSCTQEGLYGEDGGNAKLADLDIDSCNFNSCGGGATKKHSCYLERGAGVKLLDNQFYGSGKGELYIASAGRTVIVGNHFDLTTTGETSGTVNSVELTTGGSGAHSHVTITGNVFHQGKASAGAVTWRHLYVTGGAANTFVIVGNNTFYSHSFSMIAHAFTGSGTIRTPHNIYYQSTPQATSIPDELVYADDGASEGPILQLRRISTSPAVNDAIGGVASYGYDGAGNEQEYGIIRQVIADQTSTSEDAVWEIYNTRAGARTLIVKLSDALQVGATASNTGAGTINMDSALYRAGTKVVGAQGAAVADASGGATIDAEARTALNALLARLRTHGLIAT